MGKNGGISLTERFVLDKMLISDEEQQRILAALESLRETGAHEETEIIQKLGDFFKTEAPDWVAIDFSDWGGRRKELYEQLRQAILGRRVLNFDYYGQYGEMSNRTVEPVQLLFKEYTWYLRAYCRKRQAMRLFKVLRMKRVEVRDEVFVPKLPEQELLLEKGSSVVRELNKAGSGVTEGSSGDLTECVNPAAPTGNTEIVFWVDKKEAYRIYDRFDEEEITVLSEGDFRIRIKYPLDDWTYGLLLSFGASAKVESPEFVKEEMMKRIAEMQKNYL